MVMNYQLLLGRSDAVIFFARMMNFVDGKSNLNLEVLLDHYGRSSEISTGKDQDDTVWLSCTLWDAVFLTIQYSDKNELKVIADNVERWKSRKREQKIPYEKYGTKYSSNLMNITMSANQLAGSIRFLSELWEEYEEWRFFMETD